MGEILSHAEVEAILSSIQPFRPRPSQVPHVDQTVSDPVDWERYDFRRPETLRGEALNVIQALQIGLGQHATARLETLFQTRVELNLVGTCQAIPAEFLATVQPSATVCRLGRENVQSNSFIVWTTPLLQGLMTRMLGGRDPASDDSATYSMTRIQHRLLSKLNDLLLLELSSLLRTDLSIAEVRENSSVLQQPIATSFSIWISFELNCGGARGVIHLGIPRMAFDCQMSSPESKPATMASNTDSNAESIPGGIRQVTVKVSASLAKTRLRTSDLATLQVGDILMTDLSASGPILLSLEGQDLCQVAIGTHSGHKALRLLHSPIYRNSNPDH